MSRGTFLSSGIICLLLGLLAAPAGAGDATVAGAPAETQPREMVRSRPPAPKIDPEKRDWHYGGFVDLGCSLDFNFPQNHLFRNRSTTPRVNELDMNMAGAYIRKDMSEQSRWGMELLAQGGQDAKDFGFHVNQPKVGSSDQLRHFGRANLSYLAPVGNGLTVQGGLFNSLIGYDSLYAKDNINYTRPWIGDYSPYLMFGVNASYPFSAQRTGAMIPVQWNFSGPWSVAIRPEFYWDRNGRLTGFEQLVKAMTTTLGYRIPYGWTNTILRLEHRYDESTGAGGGFFKGGEVSPGVIGLTSAQHMLIFSAIWTFDSP